MTRDVPEADWKIFRGLREIALERFCERGLSEVRAIASDESRSHLSRYDAVKQRMRAQERSLGQAFDDPRRSAMVLQLAAMARMGLVTAEEMGQFSEETGRVVASLLEIVHQTSGES
jgi:hypothetical protein